MPRRTPLVAAAALVGAGLVSTTAWTASAQLPPLGPTPPPTTSSTTPSTTQPPPPPPEQAPSQPTPGPAAPSDDGSGGGSGDAVATPDAGPGAGANRIPPEYRALIDSVRRSPANNTRALLADLAQLEQFGLTPQQAAIAGMGRFPIAGTATFGDDWWYPRFVPRFHLHVGTDIFAPYGTPIRAPVDGRVRITTGKVGGFAVYVYMPDGTFFYMAHMSGFADGLADGQQVKTGQVIGYVGDSGNAKGAAPHSHLEIHPRGGAPINPKPYLDTFVADARAQVPQLVDYYRRLAVSRPAPAADAAPAGDAGPAVPPAPSPAAPVAVVDAPAPAPLLWAASMGPTASALGLAEHELVAAVRSMDWSTSPADGTNDHAIVKMLLAPLTPGALAAALL